MVRSVSQHYIVMLFPSLTTRKWGGEPNPFIKLGRVFPPSPPPRGEGWKQHYYVMLANGPYHINPPWAFYGVKDHVTRSSRVSMN
jgi:hypothetical protein